MKDSNDMETFAVRRGEVTIPVSVAGTGPTALFAPGLSCTQVDLDPLLTAFREFLTLATFDLSGHGVSSAADHYDYLSFSEDVAAVLDSGQLPDPEVLIGYSLGADLLLDRAAVMPEGPRVLVLIDGGTPMTGPMLNEDEFAMLRAAIGSEEALHEQRSLEGTPRQQLLTPDDVIRLQHEVTDQRLTATARFDQVNCPVTMIMSETMAGPEFARANEINGIWRHAVDQLATDRPSITVRRVPTGHGLVFSHVDQVAGYVRDAVAGVSADDA